MRLVAGIVAVVVLGVGGAPSLAVEEDRCESMGLLAEAIMSARQSGVVMSTAMGLAASAEEPIKTGMIEMIKLAYNKPRFSSEDYQVEAITDFRNDVELICYQAN